MNYSSAEIRATPAAVIPPFKDIYFNSNGVLFRKGIAIVNQRGSIIQRSIVKQPPPTLVAPEASVSHLFLLFSLYPLVFLIRLASQGLRSNRAILGHAAHCITPPVYDPYPAFVESCSVPTPVSPACCLFCQDS
jgi:hypothetical protein